MKFVLRILGVIWTFPNTALGIFLGLIGLLCGGRSRFIHGAWEFHGSAVRWILRKLPNRISAITLGHSILGVDEKALNIARVHEHVHVRQYEIWGPLFVPAYLLCSLVLKLNGKDPYWDNPFEKQAYAIASPDFGSGDSESDDDHH